MSALDGQHLSLRRGSGGALTERRVEAPSAEGAPRSGPRRAPGTLERRGKVYGAYTSGSAVSEVRCRGSVYGCRGP